MPILLSPDERFGMVDLWNTQEVRNFGSKIAMRRGACFELDHVELGYYSSKPNEVVLTVICTRHPELLGSRIRVFAFDFEILNAFRGDAHILERTEVRFRQDPKNAKLLWIEAGLDPETELAIMEIPVSELRLFHGRIMKIRGCLT